MEEQLKLKKRRRHKERASERNNDSNVAGFSAIIKVN
jgi:hypothetical protein